MALVVADWRNKQIAGKIQTSDVASMMPAFRSYLATKHPIGPRGITEDQRDKHGDAEQQEDLAVLRCGRLPDRYALRHDVGIHADAKPGILPSRDPACHGGSSDSGATANRMKFTTGTRDHGTDSVPASAAGEGREGPVPYSAATGRTIWNVAPLGVFATTHNRPP